MNLTEKSSKQVISDLGISELAQASGVSTRTLRHYEDCGLMRPARASNGYRIYTQADAKRLAQILAMRKCGLSLATIRHLLSDACSDISTVLRDHLRTLQSQGASLEQAIERTKAALAALERMENMDVKDAFSELKEQGIREFEDTYGAEARERYGNDAIDAANSRMMSLSKDEWEAKELLEDAVKVQLRIAIQTGDVHSEASREVAHMHEKWVAIHWGPDYQEEEYLSLVRGYLSDPRFVAYYDSACGEGATEFLVEAVQAAHRG